MEESVEMKGVRDMDEFPVLLERNKYTGQRWMIRATNEGGQSGTRVDLLDLIAWLKANKPELLD